MFGSDKTSEVVLGGVTSPWTINPSTDGSTIVKSITYTDLSGKKQTLTAAPASWATAGAGTYTFELDNATSLLMYNAQTGNTDSRRDYSLTVNTFNVVVKPFKLSVTWAAKDKFEYTGKSQSYAGVTNATTMVITPAGGVATTYYYFTGKNAELVWLDYSNPAKTEVGTYTAEIKGLYVDSSADATHAPRFVDAYKAWNYTIDATASKHDWSIVGGNVYLVVEPKTLKTIPYGAEDPADKFTKEDVKVYWADTAPEAGGHQKDTEVQTDSYKLVSGDLKFATTYSKGSDVGTYNATVSGAEVKNYTVTEVKQGSFQCVPAAVKIKPADVVVPYGQDPVELTYSFEDAVKGSGEAAAAVDAEKAGKFKVKLATDPAQPTAIGSYTISSSTTPAEYKNIKFTYGTGKYEVVKGNLKLTIDNYEGVEDGAWHGLTIDPAVTSLPNDVTIYFTETKPANVSKWTAGEVSAAQTEEIKKKDAGEYTIYYYVDAPNYGLSLYGSKKITLKAKEKATAEEVEKEIDEATKKDESGKYDSDKVKAAKADYDKLTDEEKKLVDPYKVKALNEAVKAVEAQDAADAKAVEEQIAKLPVPEKVTEADKEAIEAAKKAYDALSEDAKAKVSKDAKEKLDADVKALEDTPKKEVAAFDEKVAAVKAAKNGVDGKAAAEDAKAAYDALSDEAKALLTDEEKAAYEATQEAYKKDKTFNSGEGVFRVLSNGEVTFLKPLHPENTWFVVPNQVKKNGFNYRVVKVSTKAFMGCIKATKIKIGKNVQSMGAYAFKNTPAMTKLIFLTSKLVSGKVTNTFGGAGKSGGAKLTVVVPSGKTGSYEKLFKGEGKLNAKAKFTEED